MAEFVTLLGAEEVTRAAHTMSDAATRMCQAAASIDDAVRRNELFLTNWLVELREVLAEHTRLAALEAREEPTK